MVAGPVGQRACTWCLSAEAALTDDHVFPDCIGGTRDLVVKACRGCQTSLARAEQELARSSGFAFARQDAQFHIPKRRLKKDPASGAAQVRYMLRHDPGPPAGYDEVAVQGGRPRALPSIELDTRCVVGDPPNRRVDLSLLTVRMRGTTAEEVNALVRELLTGLSSEPDERGVIYELSAPLLDGRDARITNDASFRPRLFRDVAGRLRARARSPGELAAFLQALQALARTCGPDLARQEHWTSFTVPEGEVHLFRMEWDGREVERVLVKIAYGVAVLGALIDPAHLDLARRFVQHGTDDIVVKEHRFPGSISDWPGRHVAAIMVKEQALLAIVSIYGALHAMELAKLPAADRGWHLPVAAVCERDKVIRLHRADDEARSLARQLQTHLSASQ